MHVMYVVNFEHLNLFRISIFEFRIYFVIVSIHFFIFSVCEPLQ